MSMLAEKQHGHGGSVDLTPRQLELYSWIFAETCRHGVQPGYRDIARHFGFKSLNSSNNYLRGIAAKGYVLIARGHSRSLTFLKLPDGSAFLGFEPVRAKGAEI